MPLSTQINLAVSVKQTSTQDLGEATATANHNSIISLTSGTAAGQADRVFADTRTITASGTDDLDLAGVLLDPLGATLTFARVKAIIVKAAAGNTNDVLIGGAAATQFVAPFGAATHQVRVRPGGVLALAAGAADATGYTVGAGASDLLRFTNSAAGTSVTFDVIIVGASA